MVKGIILTERFLPLFFSTVLDAWLSPFVWIRDNNFGGTSSWLSGRSVVTGIREPQDIPEAGEELPKVTHIKLNPKEELHVFSR